MSYSWSRNTHLRTIVLNSRIELSFSYLSTSCVCVSMKSRFEKTRQYIIQAGKVDRRKASELLRAHTHTNTHVTFLCESTQHRQGGIFAHRFSVPLDLCGCLDQAISRGKRAVDYHHQVHVCVCKIPLHKERKQRGVTVPTALRSHSAGAL